MKHFKFKILAGIAAAFLLVPTACDKTYTDPSAVAVEEALKSVDGLIAVCNGLHNNYSLGRQSPIYSTVVASGLSTFEQTVTNAGNADEENLRRGGISVDGANAVTRQIWVQSYLIVNNADLVLGKASTVSDLGTQSGIIVYANLFKAMSLGNIAMFFEKAPVSIAKNAPFVSRVDVLKAALTALDAADKALTANAVSARFSSRVNAGIDLKNTIYALQARFSNMVGDNDNAITAANKVTLSAKSFFRYNATNVNPIWEVIVASNYNVTAVRNKAFGMPAAIKPDSANDKRMAFYLLSPNTVNTIERIKGFALTADGQWPVYLPSEMLLIKAEALARKGQLPEAVIELNKVVTKKAAADTWGVGADLPAFASTDKDAILQEIYRQRCVELFFSGLRLEDARRLGRNMPVKDAVDPLDETNRVFYPYPLIERDNNTNTPTDPTI